MKVKIVPSEMRVYPGGRKQWYLLLVGDNGETLAVSEMYYSRFNAKRAARKNFKGIPVEFVDG